MKKIYKILVVVVALVMLFSFTGCFTNVENIDTSGEFLVQPSEGNYLMADSINENVKTFMSITDENPTGNGGNRTAFSYSEKSASQTLVSFADSLGDYAVSTQGFDVMYDGEKEYSQNIIVTKLSSSENAKDIIFCANYDNAYYDVDEYGYKIEETDGEYGISTGMIDNATGVAVVMSLMQYYQDIELDYNLKFLFFGAGALVNYGAYYYINSLSTIEQSNIAFVFNVNRIGGDNIYVYGEEQETVQENFVYTKASDIGIKVYQKPSSMPLVDFSYIEKLPYSHWLLQSNNAHFMQQSIPVVSITTGNYHTSNTSNVEVVGQDSVSFTSLDTYAYANSYIADYRTQMQEIALLIVNTVSDDNFTAMATSSRENYPAYDFSDYDFIITLVIFGIIILLLLALVIIVKKCDFSLAKKVSEGIEINTETVSNDSGNNQKPIVTKLAVFGLEYEDTTDPSVKYVEEVPVVENTFIPFDPFLDEDPKAYFKNKNQTSGSCDDSHSDDKKDDDQK